MRKRRSNKKNVVSKSDKKILKKEIKKIVGAYNKSPRQQMDLLKAVNELSQNFVRLNSKSDIVPILNDVAAELVGTTTEISSTKEKIVQNSAIKVISEYMLAYLNDIEREIINSSTSKMKLHEKIKKMITEYLNANYFKKILIVTIVDDMIESVYGDEYTLSKYIYEQIFNMTENREELEKFFMIFQTTIDSTDIPDFKIAYRKAIVENEYSRDIICDMWKKLYEFIGEDNCLKIRNSLSMFKSKKTAYNEEFINPIIYALKDSKEYLNEEFKKIEINGKIYYGASISTLEDDNTKFERYVSKLRSLEFTEEADLLYNYLLNNISLLTDKVISEKFTRLNSELFDELVCLNHNKFSQTRIGHIILANPTDNIFDPSGNINFIVSMVMKSIFKMGEVLLINDFEFQEFQKEMLITLQQMSKLRDIETANHQDRVTVYTRILADALKKKKEDGTLEQLILKNKISSDTDYYIVDKEYVRDVVYSASLHDLGKVGIDDEILKSTKKLSHDEYEKMKNHTIFGQQRLSSIVRMSRKKSFLVLAAALAENHHEKWDGTGYPNKKKGFEIPLSARILAVADVYDALRKKRTYKDSLSHEQAMKIIVDGKNKHFDPVIVDIFIENNELLDEAFIKNKTETY
ncbi:MAG TPA: HD domain-containing phosphohydrolase [Spirochaetota bacterium]|jgi:HD-GYP domain-containing protein (c-di-GMP phosphodiesterase class II)|nr:MAG: Cyclic di-GMP phosphodiesterase response regulator RpfG [Spirochaetes bacterium ADurb.Bin133]HNZ27802.1 HD domain-containing phosphohydrolase [Spirochaetota bacterium]HOF01383.1 HD domain-containing phosphohydrolase [Spirochaetota bacterium]HOS33207.1 HD domain-containing phosphohydrolase [Spirochaetota bacterium]HOS56278.1 HD domain-containing phosphohydrolase [Spirochaetota bacterium]